MDHSEQTILTIAQNKNQYHKLQQDSHKPQQRLTSMMNESSSAHMGSAARQSEITCSYGITGTAVGRPPLSPKGRCLFSFELLDLLLLIRQLLLELLHIIG